MKTLQEQYNAIKSGKGNKAQFVKQARLLFPQYFNQYTDYNTASNVLKSKQIISEEIGGVVSKGFDIFDWKKLLSEEAKAIEKQPSKEASEANKNAFQPSDTKNADNINFNEIMKGFYCEMKDPKNADKNGDDIKAMVVKNLAKDPLYYTKDGMFGLNGVGFTDEAPGLGKNTQPKSKKASVLGGHDEVNSESDIVKNSLVGSAKKNVQDTLSDSEAKDSMPKKVKEMEVTPQNSKGVKKMAMPGKEKKIKLKESNGDAEFNSDQKEKAESLYDQGYKLFKQGKKKEAEKLRQQALKFGHWLDWGDNDLPPYNSIEESQDPNDFELNQTKPEDAPAGINDKAPSEPLKDKPQIKSTLEKISQQVFSEKDLNKAKEIFKSHVENSRVNDKDKKIILQKIDTITTKPKLDYYLANSLLHYEGKGLGQLKKSDASLKEQKLRSLIREIINTELKSSK